MSVHVLNNAELTSMILQWLKERTPGGPENGDDKLPLIPTSQWTANFAHLATVNKAFFYGSVEVLWERLGSALPLFGYVLPADRRRDGRLQSMLTYNQHKLTARHWSRFKLYAAKVKVLVLGAGAGPAMPPGWLCQLTDSKDRPPTLFPCLRHLSLSSVDPLSLYIASNSTPTLKVIKLDISSEPADSFSRGNGEAMATGLSQNALALTDLRIVSPVNAMTTEKISRIKTLNSLRITIPPGSLKDLGALYLGRLARLPALRALHLNEAPIPQDENEAVLFPNYDKGLQHYVSLEAKLEHLLDLRISANAAAQTMLAIILRPRNLRNLELEIIPDAVNVRMFILPFVLALYAKRNASLESLSVHGMTGMGLPNTSTTPIILGALRDGLLRYLPHNLEPFFSGIAGLPRLQRLEVYDVPFIDVNVLPRLLEIVPNLSLLRTLHLHPRPATALEAADQPIAADLGSLHALSQQLPHLTRLILAVRLPRELPISPPEPSAGHRLQELGLRSQINHAEFKAEDKFKLARYLEGLFPEAKMVAVGTSPQATEFWTFIDQLLSFSRDSRSRTLKEVEDFMGVGDFEE